MNIEMPYLAQCLLKMHAREIEISKSHFPGLQWHSTLAPSSDRFTGLKAPVKQVFVVTGVPHAA
jgi:hypothetical protein